ncbi:MAG: hypothetical protein JNM63_04085, partial [Spirochaetia bacterium]|nr:hypothetical protein [Spirochaetia bacterium]
MNVIADQPYRLPGSVPMAVRCTADLYLPGKTGEVDCLIWAHGGGMTTGDKSENNIVAP